MGSGGGEDSTTETKSDESPASTAESTARDVRSEETDDIDGALAIEDELRELPGSDASIDEDEAVGQVIEVQRITPDRIPDAYPIAIDSEKAIAFRVRITVGRETTVYLSWPEKYETSADLARLLNELDISPDRFADIIGEEIPLVVVDGQWVPEVSASTGTAVPEDIDLPSPPETSGRAKDGPEVVMDDGTVAVIEDETGTRIVDSGETNRHLRSAEKTAPTKSEPTESAGWYFYGVIALTAFYGGLVVATDLVFTVVPTVLTLLAILLTPVIFPYLVYRDSEYVEAKYGWSPHVGWSFGTALWFINIFVAGGYLLKRYSATQKDD